MRRVAKYGLGALVALAVWVAALAGLTFTATPGASVAVFALPGRAASVAVDAGGSLEDFSSMLVITRSDAPDFITRLYGAGAVLVIDARVVSGCRAAYAKARRGLGL